MRKLDPVQMKNNMVSYRTRKGMTQDDVALVLNVHPKTVCRWENEPTKVSLDVLEAMAIIYGCEVQDFFMD